jgi:hypothetical protein
LRRSPPPDLPSAERLELAPQYFDTDLIVTPDDNPAHSPASSEGGSVIRPTWINTL